MTMKYAFFGTPRFARLVLAELLDDMPPAAVVTNPDRPAGRKKVLTPPEVKSLLLEHESPIELLQSEKLSEAAPRLRELDPDVFVVAAYGKIIPQSVLDIPRRGVIGVHPSLLPRWRGASPIQTAILEGDETTGVSLYLMDAEVDHGPVLAQAEIPVAGMDYLELEAELAKLGAKLIKETLPQFLDGKIKPQDQDHDQATFTGKFETADGFVPWEDLERAAGGTDPDVAAAIWRKIRALNPEPGAWTEKDGRRIKLLRAEPEDGRLVLKEIQRAGKKPEQISRPLP